MQREMTLHHIALTPTIHPCARVFTLTYKGEAMINSDPDTGRQYLLTLNDANLEREEVRRARTDAGMDFIEDEWQIVAIVPVAITDMIIN